jgi:hypothetical protein
VTPPGAYSATIFMNTITGQLGAGGRTVNHT